MLHSRIDCNGLRIGTKSLCITNPDQVTVTQTRVRLGVHAVYLEVPGIKEAYILPPVLVPV